MTASTQPPAWDGSDVENYRSYLLRYATLQLRDAAAAEDAVQETLLAALRATHAFDGRSSVKTWLTGILKHKIIDQLRRDARQRPLLDSDLETGDAGDIADATFAEDGHWHEFPADWGTPERSLESKEFWAVFEMCVQVMPARAARVFVMREVMELSTEEICKELAISATNCWVMLHRARLALRACLETKWFKA